MFAYLRLNGRPSKLVTAVILSYLLGSCTTLGAPNNQSGTNLEITETPDHLSTEVVLIGSNKIGEVVAEELSEIDIEVFEKPELNQYASAITKERARKIIIELYNEIKAYKATANQDINEKVIELDKEFQIADKDYNLAVSRYNNIHGNGKLPLEEELNKIRSVFDTRLTLLLKKMLYSDPKPTDFNVMRFNNPQMEYILNTLRAKQNIGEKERVSIISDLVVRLILNREESYLNMHGDSLVKSWKKENDN